MKLFLPVQLVLAAIIGALTLVWHPAAWGFLVWAALWAMALRDLTQPRHSLLRNFPVFARMRWLMEVLRPGVRETVALDL